MKAIIFDFDGVIHDTFDFHRTKIREFTGIHLPEDDFRDIHNGNFFHNKVNALEGIHWPDYRDFILPEQSCLCIESDTKEILHTLSEQYNLFIVSSGGEENITGYLKNNGLDDVFTEVFGLESSLSKVDKFNSIFQKHSLEPDDCIFITDTLGDILEANKVSLKTIAVTFGFHSKETLENGNPHMIISQPNELLAILTSNLFFTDEC